MKMTSPIPGIVAVAILILSVRVLPAQTATNFAAYVASWQPPTPLATNGLSQVTNGITLGKIVEHLGPGWMSPAESCGIIRWSFMDGRTLCVWPSQYASNEIIGTNRLRRGRMWLTQKSEMETKMLSEQSAAPLPSAPRTGPSESAR